MYCEAFKVDFEVKKSTIPIERKYLKNIKYKVCLFSIIKYDILTATKYVPDISDPVRIRVCALYRPSNEWKHDSYIIAAQIYHGTRPIGHPVLSQPCIKTEQDSLWPARIIIDQRFVLKISSTNT